MALCHITGTVYLPSGEVAANRIVEFYKISQYEVTADYLGAVTPEVVKVRLNASGQIDVHLITSHYYGDIFDRNGKNSYRFKATVPEQASALFSDIIEAADPVEPLPAWLQQVLEARDEARGAVVESGAEADRAEDAAEQAEMFAPFRINTGVTITVGALGDYQTLNDALDEASKYLPLYQKNGVTVEVLLLSGFVMQEQVLIYQRDLGYIVIRSEDAEVTISRASLTSGMPVSNWRTGVYPAFAAMGQSTMPVVGCVFNMDATGDGSGRTGYFLGDNSYGLVLRGCGVRNSAWRGLYTAGAIVFARETVWSGSGFNEGPARSAAIRISNGSVANVRDSDASGSTLGLYAAESIVMATDLNVSGAVYIDGNRPGIGIMSVSASLNAASCDASNCDKQGVVAQGSSSVSVNNSDLSGCGDASIDASGGAVVTATDADASGSLRGISAYSGAIVFAHSSDLSKSTDRAISATAAIVIAPSSNIVGVTGSNAVRGFEGATINVCNSSIKSTGTELLVNSGAVIIATGATDGAGGLPRLPFASNTQQADGMVVIGVQPAMTPGDTSVTVASSSPPVVIYDAPLTTHRQVAVPAATYGAPITVIRTADSTGPFEIRINRSGVGDIATLPAAGRVVLYPNSGKTAWIVT